MDQYKKQTHKWMVIQPIELKHPSVNVAKKLAEISLRICICELISFIGNSNAHPDAHSDHVLLTDNRVLGYIFGQIEAKWKILARGFCAE